MAFVFNAQNIFNKVASLKKEREKLLGQLGELFAREEDYKFKLDLLSSRQTDKSLHFTEAFFAALPKSAIGSKKENDGAMKKVEEITEAHTLDLSMTDEEHMRVRHWINLLSDINQAILMKKHLVALNQRDIEVFKSMFKEVAASSVKTVAEDANRDTWAPEQGGIDYTNCCLICLEAVRDHVNRPCGHLCACGPCADKRAICVVCNQAVSWIQDA
jgi:hypothetical protein